VMARETELGIVSFKPNDDSVKSVAVITDELTLVVSPKHHLANKKSVSIKELGSESFIAHNAPSPYRHKVIETFEKYRTPLNIAIELPSLEAIKHMVELNAGIAFVPKLTAENELKTGQLKGLAVNEMRLERKLHIIYRRNSVLSQAAQGFLEVAREMQQN
jgi:DNA-binding transcriptional LysR family regulator